MLHYFSPLAWGRWLGQFVSSWAASVPWGRAPKAIPAIALLVIMGVTAAIALVQTSSWRADLLNRQLQSALEADDFETAEVLLQRQLGRRPNDSEIAYRLATSRDAQGKHDEALELMETLVHTKQYVPAARWILSKQFLAEANRSRTSDEAESYGELLELIHRETPDDIQVKLLYVKHLISKQSYPKAIPLLVELSELEPMFGLQAAILERSLGNESSADRYAQSTLATMRSMLADDPTNGTLVIAVVQNQLFLKQYTSAVDLLDQSIPRVRTEKAQLQLRQAMGDAIVAWVNSIEEAEVESKTERLRVLRLLEIALRYAPHNARVLQMVSDHVLATVNEEDEEIVALRRALIGGSSSGIAHFIRGTAALMKDDVQSATVELKLAAEHLPHSAAILNNLAVALSRKGDEHLEQALKISEESIRQAPVVTPYFYETRGQILFRLGRHMDAIPDLERALPEPAIADGAHRSLAVCYEKIGQHELGRLHREAAGE